MAIQLNEKQICKFKGLKNLKGLDGITSQPFYFKSISKDFTKNEIEEIALNSKVYVFSVDCGLTDVKAILYIHG